MKTPIIDIQVKSIYKKGNQPVMLPARLAKCTPDFYIAIQKISEDLAKKGGELVLSDLFRSYDMQYQAYIDYKTGKKKAYSPPPGGSMHEAGRAMDIDLSKIKISLKDFWDIAQKYGCSPIISKPDTKLSESWHFDCRGSHAVVYEYYKKGKGNNMPPYTAMAVSAILAAGIQADKFAGKNKEAFIQSGLIRLGYEIGNIDGSIGKRTNAALKSAGINLASIDEITRMVEDKLQAEFPAEFTAPAETYSDE